MVYPSAQKTQTNQSLTDGPRRKLRGGVRDGGRRAGLPCWLRQREPAHAQANVFCRHRAAEEDAVWTDGSGEAAVHQSGWGVGTGYGDTACWNKRGLVRSNWRSRSATDGTHAIDDQHRQRKFAWAVLRGGGRGGQGGGGAVVPERAQAVRESKRRRLGGKPGIPLYY